MDQSVRLSDRVPAKLGTAADDSVDQDAPVSRASSANRTRSHDLLQIRSKQGNEPEARAPQENDKADAKESDHANDKDAAGAADADGKTDDGKSSGQKPKGRFAFLRAHPFWTLGGAILLVAAVIAGTLYYLEARHFENSDDAFIDARQFSVAPRVSGVVSALFVTDNQFVRTGDPLFHIDPRDYEVTVAQTHAALDQAQAQIGNVDAQIEGQKAQVDVATAQVTQTDAALQFAKQEEQRALDLVAKGAGTLQTEQQRRSGLVQAQADSARTRASLLASQRQITSLQAQRKSAEANRDAAAAQYDQAKLNLSYTDVRAAQNGTIARLTGAVGQYVQAGQAVTMYVPDRLWVTANFKETQITDMRPGQPVTIHIDAYPNRKIDGHIDSIQSGSGTAFSLLPAENATGNYVKVVQRIPVKIAFDNVPSDVALGPGMSVVPSVRVR